MLKKIKTISTLSQSVHRLKEKFTEDIIDKTKRKYINNMFNKHIRRYHPYFIIDENNLKNNNLTKKVVIENSIKFIYPKLEFDVVKKLIKEFEIFTHNKKIKVVSKETLPIYTEIVEILSYSKEIDTILNDYPIQDSNSRRTRFGGSNRETLIDIQINTLKDRLENPYFKVKNKNEVKKIELQIKVLEHSKKENYKDFPEQLNYMNLFYGLDNKFLEHTEIEIEAFNELLNFFNGIKTNEIALLNSFTFYTSYKSGIYDKDYAKKLSEAIYEITYTLFQTTIEAYNLGKTRKYTYSESQVNKDFKVKTFFKNTAIFNTREDHDEKNFIEKLKEIGIKSILGLKNTYEPELPNNKEVNNYYLTKKYYKH